MPKEFLHFKKFSPNYMYFEAVFYLQYWTLIILIIQIKNLMESNSKRKRYKKNES